MSANGLKAYPNPLNEQNLVIKTNFDGISTITISDITGKQAYAKVTAENETNVPRSVFYSGTYIISVTNDAVAQNIKLVVR
ncbi:MAG: T9SS type A sorting domain-containing protein [Bacteroidales bacterium]|nr:T9SS type A sorting domain-containing protein [Bacteroidales bacterium]